MTGMYTEGGILIGDILFAAVDGRRKILKRANGYPPELFHRLAPGRRDLGMYLRVKKRLRKVQRVAAPRHGVGKAQLTAARRVKQTRKPRLPFRAQRRVAQRGKKRVCADILRRRTKRERRVGRAEMHGGGEAELKEKTAHILQPPRRGRREPPCPRRTRRR